MAFYSQDGIKSKINGGKLMDYTATNLFTGVWNLSQENLDKFDPFIQGYAFFIWTKLPVFFEEAFKQQFKALTEKNLKSLSGISDMTLGDESLSIGFAGNEYPVATNITKENTSFSLSHYELQGSPIRELYDYWVRGIRDPETGLAHYHGKIESGDLEYSAKNHTGECLYVVTDPSGAVGGSTGIEYAAYFTNVFPLKIPMDHLNYSSGDHSSTEITIEFRGNYHAGKDINTFAIQAMDAYKITKQFGQYKLNPESGLMTLGYNE